ncbi:MAG: hypothetical protein ABI333_20645 [bacterium]
MDERERTVFLTAYRMALADGELSANEALLLNLFAKGLGITTEELFSLKKEAARVDLESLPEKFPDRGEQLALVETIYLVAMIDGRDAPEEQQLVARLTELFALTQSESGKCLRAARTRMRKLGQQHDLLTEVLANTEKEDA